MYKKIILSVLVFSSLSLFGFNENTCNSLSCQDIEKQGVLPSARKCIGSMCECRKAGFISNIDFLYFQAKEDCFDYVAKNDGDNLSTGASTINLNANTSSFDFSYKPGFKLGIGMYIPRLSWDIYFNWTQLNSKCNNSDHLAIDNHSKGLIPLFWTSAAFDNQSEIIRFENSKAELDFYFNSLDVEMGDSYYTSPNISIRLHGGLKGAIIHQKFNAFYENGNTINVSGDDITLLTGSTKLKSDSQGLGPRIGFDTSWKICNSDFNILANSSFAFLLTRFDVHQHEFDTAYSTNLGDISYEYKIHEYVWVVRPAAHLKLGINWGKCLGACKNFYLGINAAYEVQYFWEQNLTRRATDNQVVGITYPNKGDLFLHGLILSTHFEF